MAGSVAISQVAMGTERVSACLNCGAREIVFEIVALLPSGVLPIGMVSMCDEGCGDLWHCGFCTEVFPADGVRAHRHMLARHSA